MKLQNGCQSNLAEVKWYVDLAFCYIVTMCKKHAFLAALFWNCNASTSAISPVVIR